MNNSKVWVATLLTTLISLGILTAYALAQNGNGYSAGPSTTSSSSVSGGLIATYSCQNTSTLTLTADSSEVLLCSIAGVVVGSGQKVIVHESVGYKNTSTTGVAAVQTYLNQGATFVDAVETDCPAAAATNNPGFQTMTRVFEYTPGAGTYTYNMDAFASGNHNLSVLNADAGTTPGSGLSLLSQAQLVIEVVSL
jgi:hypothetical protein